MYFSIFFIFLLAGAGAVLLIEPLLPSWVKHSSFTAALLGAALIISLLVLGVSGS